MYLELESILASFMEKTIPNSESVDINILASCMETTVPNSESVDVNSTGSAG
jgi:hypothetical protein